LGVELEDLKVDLMAGSMALLKVLLMVEHSVALKVVLQVL
jgi:hypothetical protein